MEKSYVVGIDIGGQKKKNGVGVTFFEVLAQFNNQRASFILLA